jgi:hypothetical protein
MGYMPCRATTKEINQRALEVIFAGNFVPLMGIDVFRMGRVAVCKHLEKDDAWMVITRKGKQDYFMKLSPEVNTVLSISAGVHMKIKHLKRPCYSC